MRALLAGVPVVVLLAVGVAHADCGDCRGHDVSWWGNSDATPGPHRDAVRSGHWWWPAEYESNEADSVLWGNRGVVYSIWAEPEPKKIDPVPVPRPFINGHGRPILVNILFDFDESELRAAYQAAADEVVAEMKKHGKDTLVIEGHTCSEGEEAYNTGLGQRRADAVKEYMVEQGIAASRIETKSYGETQPAIQNDNARQSQAQPARRLQSDGGRVVLKTCARLA